MEKFGFMRQLHLKIPTLTTILLLDSISANIITMHANEIMACDRLFFVTHHYLNVQKLGFPKPLNALIIEISYVDIHIEPPNRYQS